MAAREPRRIAPRGAGTTSSNPAVFPIIRSFCPRKRAPRRTCRLIGHSMRICIINRHTTVKIQIAPGLKISGATSYHGSTRRGALRRHLKQVERLARGHEQPVALRSAESQVGADLGQADTPDQLALRREA